MLGLQWAPDAKYWHRLWSVRFAVVGAAFTVASVVFPGLLGFVNPFERPATYGLIATAFFAAVLVSRLVDQERVPNV